MAEAKQADRTQLLKRVPVDGSTIGNTALMKALGWTEDRYWLVRNSLVESGELVLGKGRGGSVRSVRLDPLDDDAVQVEVLVEEQRASYDTELALYEPMKVVLETDWASDQNIEPLGVVITAIQGRRQTGGKWSRPDIVVFEVSTYLHIPGKHLSVITFEVKPSDSIDVTAVYEALAHRRAGTHAYVLAHVPDSLIDDLAPNIEEICQVARTHGVGVIIAGDPADYGTWEEKAEAVRIDPDPRRLDEFIRVQGSDVADRLKQAVR